MCRERQCLVYTSNRHRKTALDGETTWLRPVKNMSIPNPTRSKCFLTTTTTTTTPHLYDAQEGTVKNKLKVEPASRTTVTTLAQLHWVTVTTFPTYRATYHHTQPSPSIASPRLPFPNSAPKTLIHTRVSFFLHLLRVGRAGVNRE